MNVFWQKVINMLDINENKSAKHDLRWQEAAEQARNDWIYAKRFYENVTDSDLIDYAIYMILATERKYMYIIKKIKELERLSV